MSPPPSLPGPRQVASLGRSVALAVDPVALYAARSDQGRRRDTLLFESADRSTASGERSLVMTRAALSLRGRGPEVLVEALGPNGRSVLGWLGEALADRGARCERTGDRFVARFPPPRGGGSEAERLAAPSPLDVVRAAVLGLEQRGGEPALAPLVAGSWAYDLLGVYEDLPAPASDRTGWPDFELWLADELVLVQHGAGRTTVLCHVFGGEHAAACYHDAERRVAATVALCEELAAGGGTTTISRPPGAPVDLASEPLGELEVDLGDERFAALVTTLKGHIVRGDVFQIVPSRAFSLPCPDPLAAYRELGALNPSPYMFYLAGAAGILFGASPESALTVRGTPRRVLISPIAGTRPRGRHDDGRLDADLDSRLEAELRLDEKEVAEHMMLVDLARNDVARVCKPGTRTVERLLEVVRHSHVMHLRSLVSGELRAGLDALHAYVATMNMGTLVGAPKLAAARLLRAHEPARRGPYGGAVGYLTSRGELDSCVVIRSAIVQDGRALVRAGAGVVFDSDPRAEADETRRKAEAVLRAIARAAGARADREGQSP